MTAQTQIDFGKKLAEAGMKAAEINANARHHGWSEKALEFLKGYAEINPIFLAEDVRFASQGIVPSPPSQRSWGSIMVQAAKEGWIYNKEGETRKVKNSKAHRANANVWRSRIVKI